MTAMEHQHQPAANGAHPTPSGYIGAAVKRVEDPTLLAGKGCYVDDIQLPGMLHMALLRSPYAKTRITSIDTSAARAVPGVEAVLTGEDVPAHIDLTAPPIISGMKVPPHPALARGVAHAAGTPVAAVVAQSRAIAEDAVNRI